MTHRHVRAGALLAAAALVVACAAPDPVLEDTTTTLTGATTSAVSELPVAAGLTTADVDGLLWMREEEKLAHDVYVALFERWGLPIFESIAGAETRHARAVAGLLSAYAIDDPADGNPDGLFVDPDLQALYDALVEQGSESVVAALEVGAAVEEMDILDLEELDPSRPDIARVYEQLTRGSRNHLRAFADQLERRGVLYEPAEMDPDRYLEIVGSDRETGPGAGTAVPRTGRRGRGHDDS